MSEQPGEQPGLNRFDRLVVRWIPVMGLLLVGITLLGAVRDSEVRALVIAWVIYVFGLRGYREYLLENERRRLLNVLRGRLSVIGTLLHR